MYGLVRTLTFILRWEVPVSAWVSWEITFAMVCHHMRSLTTVRLPVKKPIPCNWLNLAVT